MWNEELLEQFILLLSEELRSDWVLCGASVLPLLGIKTRTTWDIDIFGIDNPSQAESFHVMELAESLGIPAECINLSGGYYLSQIPNYESNLVLMQEAKAKIFRPNFYLFTCLKLQRFSEVDYLDCNDLFEKEAKNNSSMRKKVHAHLLKEMTKVTEPEKAKRMVQLMQTMLQN